MIISELTREQLMEIVTVQAIFTEGLRRAATVAIAHANHLVSNYAKEVPGEKMNDWAKVQVEASVILMHPAPVGPPVIQ